MKKRLDPEVKLFSGILFTNQEKLKTAVSNLTKYFGPVDFISQEFAFNSSNYYEEEMGSPIKRQFISFVNLISPQKLPEIKLTCNEIEQNVSIEGKRKVNLDPGYLDYDKIVLASLKYNGQKLYLSQGIWADLTLHYAKGKFRPYPWSFPDFTEGLYNETFLRIRDLYKKNLSHKKS